MDSTTAPRTATRATSSSGPSGGGGGHRPTEQHAPGVAVPDAALVVGRGAPSMPEALWTAEDVAAYLKVSASMVYKLRREGKLPFVGVGALYRFDPEVIRAYVRGEVTTPRRAR